MTPLPPPLLAAPALMAAVRPALLGRIEWPGAPPVRAATRRHALLEFGEDAVLLLLVVFMFPAVIVALALPIAVVLQLASAIADRW